ncbi:GumA [Desulforapulum autotrophicum HRM2]|uniref:GumA n=1 Tax=Desulforapulum autotrophicum (strain ATCC 43914 / DSM 3382 / VKM B-1955 / HRM2) TaxID=177437 RepID=C0QH01_DESAH|nr:polysaccharide biosynthesis/export family protein [Desulforapulum autotrophicum]ACN15650.1 GumA [Desulforapulum autotrophicum HRM2]
MKRFLILIVFLLVLCGVVPSSFAGEYFVGNGDVLAINVYENEDLSTTVRVTADNTIRVPLIGEVSVKGLSVSQVSKKLEDLFADGYLINPQVDVFIKEYRSKKATILGQIRNPGLFELQGEITLLEFISTAGGILIDAGNTATIKRKKPKDNQEDSIIIDLERLIKEGDTSLNLPIRDGDSVYIAKADIFYVSGEVKKPDSYKLDSDMSVIKAITKAGGFSKIASKGKVRIIRLINNKKQVLENVNMDEPVMPDDVIVVPESFF